MLKIRNVVHLFEIMHIKKENYNIFFEIIIQPKKGTHFRFNNFDIEKLNKNRTH